MCGIFGIAGPDITQDDLLICHELGMVSQLRGMHGTGFMQVKVSNSWNKKNHKVTTDIFKKPLSYWDAFRSLRTDKNSSLLNDVQQDVIAGHVRHATRGVLSLQNTHPFDFPNLIGMHNGTLSNWHYNSRDKTDSELLFQDMNDKGIVPVLEGLDKRLDAYAIVIWDKKEEELIFSKNNERPLHFCLNSRRDVLYWASESWMLREILTRNREKLKDDLVWTPPSFHLIRIKPSKISHRNTVEQDTDFFTGVEYTPKTYTTINVKSDFSAWHRVKPSNNKPKIPVQFCVACNTKMNLLEQHRGVYIGDDTFSCFECETALTNLEEKAVV